jgi:hypothetical protein
MCVDVRTSRVRASSPTAGDTGDSPVVARPQRRLYSQIRVEINERGFAMGHREELIARSIPLLSEVKDTTPGAEMERWLNRKYGEDSPLYKDLARLIKLCSQH